MNSKELKGYFTGLILGDGYIDSGVTKRAFRIKSINLDFIEKIKKDLEKTNFEVVIKHYPAETRDGVSRQAYKELTIKAHPYFNKIYNYFYTDKGERYIHPKTLEWLTPAGWANWYMSDGYIVKVGLTKGKIVDRRVELATDRYPLDDVNRLRRVMGELGYKTTLVNRGKGHYRVRISLLYAQYFLLKIEPHVVDSMRFKLNMAYDYQPKWMDDNYYSIMESLQSTNRLTNPYSGS